LITRTTKTFEPTAYGNYIYNNLRNVPAFTESVLKSYHTKRKNNKSGTLNVAIGTAVSYELISPYIDEFLELNPNVRLNIKFMNQIHKWPSEDTNIVLGMSEINHQMLDSKFIRTEKAKLYCSKEYALKYGLPEKPDQLVNHRIIGMLHDEILDDHMLIHNLKNNASFILDLSNMKVRTNNLLHNKKIGMSLHYIFGSNDSLVSRDLQNGTIIPVLPDWYTLEVSLYLTTKKTINKLERSFVEFIYERMNKSYDLVMTNLMDISNQVE
jgi:DNA-binding transcriptional LysR family regulator